MDIGFTSDASKNSKLGFGCIMKNSWLWGRWEPGFVETFDPSIEFLELFALCAGVLTWEAQLVNMWL